ncbi:MAG: hypothetical protein Q9226_006934 [Calogaya cf. arnoldii]
MNDATHAPSEAKQRSYREIKKAADFFIFSGTERWFRDEDDRTGMISMLPLSVSIVIPILVLNRFSSVESRVKITYEACSAIGVWAKAGMRFLDRRIIGSMYYSTNSLVTLLPLLACAAPVAQLAPGPGPFTLYATHPGAFVHLQPIAAYSGGFYTGLGADRVTKVTSLEVSKDTSAYIVDDKSQVQVYIDRASGALSYVSNHKQYRIPKGAIRTGFGYKEMDPAGPNNIGGRGEFMLQDKVWEACESKAMGPEAFMVYAKGVGKAKAKKGCVEIGAFGVTVPVDNNEKPATSQ